MKMQWLVQLAKIGDIAEEIPTSKTENAPAKLKNLQTRNCSIRIEIQLGKERAVIKLGDELEKDLLAKISEALFK